MTYVKAARELPFLSDEEIEAKAVEYGFVDGSGDVEGRVGSRIDSAEKAVVRVEESVGQELKHD